MRSFQLRTPLWPCRGAVSRSLGRVSCGSEGRLAAFSEPQSPEPRASERLDLGSGAHARSENTSPAGRVPDKKPFSFQPGQPWVSPLPLPPAHTPTASLRASVRRQTHGFRPSPDPRLQSRLHRVAGAALAPPPPPGMLLTPSTAQLPPGSPPSPETKFRSHCTVFAVFRGRSALRYSFLCVICRCLMNCPHS